MVAHHAYYVTEEMRLHSKALINLMEDEVLRGRPLAVFPGWPMNYSERQTRAQLRAGLCLDFDVPKDASPDILDLVDEFGKRFRLWHEAPLAAFLTHPKLAVAGDRHAEELKWRTRGSSIDILVTSSFDDCSPLFGVEFDGPLHETEPEKKKYDGLTDEAFARAGLPLVRVKVGDVKRDEKLAWAAVRHAAQYVGLVWPTVDRVFTERKKIYLGVAKRIRNKGIVVEGGALSDILHRLATPLERERLSELESEIVERLVDEEVQHGQRLADLLSGVAILGKVDVARGPNGTLASAAITGGRYGPERHLASPPVSISGSLSSDIRRNVEAYAARQLLETVVRERFDVNDLS